MKKRLLIVFVAFVCAIACAVGLAACATPDGKSEGEKNPLSVAGNSYVYSSVSVANENETLRIYAEALKKEIADDMSGAVFSFDGNGGCSSVIGGKAAKGTYTQKGAEVSATLGGEAYSFDAAEKSISTTRATEYEINKGGSLLPGLSGLPAIGQTEKVSFNVTVTFVKSAGGNKPVTPVEPEKPAGSACTHIGSLWHYTDGEASTCKKEGWELDVYICKGTENEGTKDERICGKVFLTEEAAKSDDFATVLHNVEDKEELQNLTTFRKSLPLAGHTPVTDGAVEATCSEKGLTEGSHCGVCGTILKAQKETDAIEHSFTDTVTFESQPAVNVEICSMCGISREGVSYTFSLNGNKDGYILEKVGNLLSVGSMEIPCRHNGKPVTDIGENCAVNAWWLEEITIPNGIKTIGGGAFGNSQSLKKVNIPDGVESIGNGAFTFCYSLSEVTIPASVTHMGENVFYKGHGLTVYCEAAERPQGWSYSWNYIYAGQDYCTVVWDCNKNSQDGSGYEYAVINGLRYALKGDEATVVSQPNNKSIVKIPSTIVVNSKVYDVTRINSNAFHNVSGGNFSCHNLAHITIPESVTYIGSNTFGDSRVTIYCEAAEKPDGWSDGWTSDCAVVWNCNNNNEDEDGNIHTVIDGIYYSLKDGEATVRRQPNTVENVNIPSTVSFNKKNYVVTRIDDAAFYCNYNLKSVTLPDSITDICGNAFYSCLRLQCNEYGNAYYLGNSVNPYLMLISAKNTAITTCTIHEKTKFIQDYAFNNCSSLTKITMPDGVMSIGNYAFKGCRSLTDITIPDSVTGVGYGAFEYCYELQYNEYDNAYYLGNSINRYVVLVKAKNEEIASCAIHENTKVIYSTAFRSCFLLTDITIPVGVTSIGDYVFDYCDLLTSINFNGTKAQWEAVEKGNIGGYTIICTDGDIEING